MKRKLNLGCGKDIKKGYINLDITKLPGVDIVHDLDKYPYPFKDNEFDEVYCHHVLEHINSIIKPMEELFRITKPGAKIIIEAPIFPSVGSMADPTHKVFYTYYTFNYFKEDDNLNYYSKARFKIIKRKIIFSSYLPFMTWFVNCSEITKKIYAMFFSFFIPAEVLYVELENAKK